ncbi:MAG: CoA transferase [Desulfobacteraceae bacterium]|nr:CoA transferase [Desulfobacteraceae bacterium]
MSKILEDIRILDFTHVWFGPYCTMMLAELGAEVIKIEPPWGTIGRLGPGAIFKGVSTTFYALNLNKKDVSVDLKSEEGLSIVKELLKKSDVVVQNFVPGTLERLGLGYDVQKKLKKDIIYAALSGFGQSGPYSGYASFAVVAEAMSGHTFANAKKLRGNGSPVTMPGAMGDLGPAMYGAFAIVAAIRHRDRTGEGQMIDVNQTDCMVAFNTCSSVGHNIFAAAGLERPERRDDPTSVGGMYEVNDGWVMLMGARARALDSLKEAMGVEELSKDVVKEYIKGMTRREAFKFISDTGFPAAPVYEAHEAMTDPHLLERGMWVEADHPVAGKYRVPNFPVKFYKTPGKVVSAAPMLGQHTEEVLTTLLDYTPEQVKALEKDGKIVCWRK